MTDKKNSQPASTTESIRAATVLQAILEAIPAPIFCKDEYGIYLSCNSAFENFVGRTREELIGSGVHDLWAPELADVYFRADDELLRRGGSQIYEAEVDYADGSRHSVIFHKAVFHADEEGLSGLVGVILDITDLKKTQNELLLARSAAEQANRHKSAFLANMAHELRTPLNAIIGFADFLAKGIGGDLNDKQDEYVRDIRNSGDHLLTLINDVLDMSKIEAGKLDLRESRLNIGEQVVRCLPFVREQAQTGNVALESCIETDLPPYLADERMLRQMMVNLLSNGVKFTPAGGRVTISARRAPEGNLVIAVADTGKGIAEADIPLVLHPYGQAPEDQKLSGSTGLGLPLVKRLTELHGGTLELSSIVGQGTVATIRLPAERFS